MVYSVPIHNTLIDKLGAWNLMPRAARTPLFMGNGLSLPLWVMGLAQVIGAEAIRMRQEADGRPSGRARPAYVCGE